MSLKLLGVWVVSEEMGRVAHAVFPRGNVFMQLRDTLGAIYTDEAKARPVSYPWSTRFSPVAPGTGDGVSMYGRLDGSPSRRCRARSAGLEIRPQPGTLRSWPGPYRPLRRSLTSG